MQEYKEIREAILKQEAMPSMRLMQFSGKAAAKTNVAAYNCSFTAPETFQDLAEIMYISDVEQDLVLLLKVVTFKNFHKLKFKPEINYQTTHVVEDSREGWADAFSLGRKTWAAGDDIGFDYSTLRPEGLD